MVREFAKYVFGNHGATMIIADPSPDNLRAVRCYQKAGFEAVGPTETPDGVALLMVKKREAP